MYIISKFRDYYDGAVGTGIDKTIVYERKFISMPIPNHIKEQIQERDAWRGLFTHTYGYTQLPKGKYNTYLIVIGFCGKLYPAIKTERHNDNPIHYHFNILTINRASPSNLSKRHFSHSAHSRV